MGIRSARGSHVTEYKKNGHMPTFGIDNSVSRAPLERETYSGKRSRSSYSLSVRELQKNTYAISHNFVFAKNPFEI
jgi:hypothetical protein